jgi:hypothetical protein
MSKNKYQYLWVIQIHTQGYGWEDVDEGDKSDVLGQQHSLKEHRLAYRGMGIPVRSITRRELNTETA